MSPSGPHRSPSAIDALGEGISHMREKLFPFSFVGWVTLGFVSLLESCGSGSGGGIRNNFPSGSGPYEDPTHLVEGALAWIASHMILFVSILMGVMLISLVIMWVRSRTIFVYIDDVATGRFDIVRPWSQHSGHADSFFFLSLIVQGASFILMHKTQDKPVNATNALSFFSWALKNGDKTANDLDYVPMPAAVKAQIEKSWTEIKDVAGKPVAFR